MVQRYVSNITKMVLMCRIVDNDVKNFIKNLSVE